MRLGRLVTGHYMAGYVCLLMLILSRLIKSAGSQVTLHTHTCKLIYDAVHRGRRKEKKTVRLVRGDVSLPFFLFHNTNLLVLIIPLLLFLSFFPYALANGCPFVSMENKQQYWACVNLSVVLNEQEEKQRRKTLRLHIFCFVSSFGSVFVLQTW